MTTSQLKNNYENRLALPNGQTVEPGDTVTVENWNQMESNNVIQAWLAAGVIEVTEPNPVDEPGHTATVENWNQMESNNVNQARLAAGVIEVTEPNPVDEPEPVTTAASKKPAKTGTGAKTNEPASSSPASGEPAPAIGEPIVNNEPAPADAPSWKDPK